MNKPVLKSILSILIGFVTSVILSIGTDILFEKTGIMIREPFVENPWWIIVFIVAYRTIYNIAGCFITAKLAPNKPMKHVMIIGFIGLALGIIGTIVMWNVPPHWYPVSLDILALPSAWLGGKLAIRNKSIIKN